MAKWLDRLFSRLYWRMHPQKTMEFQAIVIECQRMELEAMRKFVREMNAVLEETKSGEEVINGS